MSIEQMCRDLLDAAIGNDKVVTFVPPYHGGSSCPQELCAGDLVAMGNLLAKLMRMKLTEHGYEECP